MSRKIVAVPICLRAARLAGAGDKEIIVEIIGDRPRFTEKNRGLSPIIPALFFMAGN